MQHEPRTDLGDRHQRYRAASSLRAEHHPREHRPSTGEMTRGSVLRGLLQCASNSTGGRTLGHLAVTSQHRAPRTDPAEPRPDAPDVAARRRAARQRWRER
jgi:hypothetical protein